MQMRRQGDAVAYRDLPAQQRELQVRAQALQLRRRL
jgi:hypothetical protein